MSDEEPDHLRSVAADIMRSAFERGRAAGFAEAQARAIEAAEALLHIVSDEPQPGEDQLDKTARYSNGTVRRVVAAIKALSPSPDSVVVPRRRK